MDLIFLDRLEENPMNAFEAIMCIHEEFHVLVSSGFMYSIVYSLERQGLVSANEIKRKRVYNLTEDGKEKLVFLLKK